MTDYCTTVSTVTRQTGTLMEHYRPKNVPASLYRKQKQTYKGAVTSTPTTESLVVDFFKQNQWPDIEALKFFNHYQGIGWKIGGKIPIVDWQATARNWMLKATALKKENGLNYLSHFWDNLKTNNEKNYGEPL